MNNIIAEEQEMVEGVGQDGNNSAPKTISESEASQEQNEDEDKYRQPSTSSDEADPEYDECMERERIVDKYDKGAEGQEVDEWENPDFELYKVTDRYGFMHQSSLSPTKGKGDHKDLVSRELRRDAKWLKMLGKWDKVRGGPKLRLRVWKGIPDKLRAEVWKRLLRVPERVATNSGVYEQLKIRARLLAKDLKQIDLDINRTYRDHVFFRIRYDEKQRALLHVLSAYSVFNTEVGYCQGMSQIVALLLMYMDEEEAFWTLHALMVEQRHAMHAFFIPGFPKLLRFQSHFERVCAKYLSRLKKHMDKMGAPTIYTTKWFFGCFLDRVPFTLALRLWDVYILEGDAVLIGMSYNIMKMHQRSLRKMNFESMMHFLQEQLMNDFGYSDDDAMLSLGECLRKLRSDRMHVPPVSEEEKRKEEPSVEFGPILSQPLDEIYAQVEQIRSRRPSRANSGYLSFPATPGHKSKMNGVQEQPSNKVSRPVSPTRVAAALRASDVPNDQLSASWSESRHPSSPERNGPPRLPSFYDNVPETQEQSSEERSFERVQEPDGSVSYQSEHWRCVTQVQTVTTVTEPTIRHGANHVTYVRLESDRDSWPQSSPQRFPVSPGDLPPPSSVSTWSGSHRQTVV